MILSPQTRYHTPPDLPRFWREADAKVPAMDATPDASHVRLVMAMFELSHEELAKLMGVEITEVNQWQEVGPTPEHHAKFATIVKITDLLHHHLREGLPAVVARRRAEAYGGRNLLEVIADDDHEWLHQDIQKSFDYSQIV